MILVSGGTGLLGAHLLVDLVRQNQAIRAIYRNEKSMGKTKHIFSYYFDDYEEAFRRIQWIKADIMDVSALSEAFKGIHQVYHSAALVSFVPAERNELLRTNVNGTGNMINCSLENNVEKFCHVSSVASIGNVVYNKTVTEDDDFKTDARNSGYALSKYLSELEVWRGIAEGLNAVIVNPSIIIGPGDWNNGSGKLFQSIYKGFPFYPTGKTGFVDVRDVSVAMIALMENMPDKQRFIISEKDYFYKEVLDLIAHKFSKKPPAIKTNPFLSGMAWRIEAAKTFLTGKRPIITKESVKNAFRQKGFSNTRLVESINMKFTPLDETIEHTVRCFLKDQET